MLITEEEAKTKWCPFVRAVENGSLTGTPSFNRIQDKTGMVSIPPSGFCIASQCMAWRWGAPYYTNDVGVTPRGSCGLAGDAPAIPTVVHYRGEDAE